MFQKRKYLKKLILKETREMGKLLNWRANIQTIKKQNQKAVYM